MKIRSPFYIILLGSPVTLHAFFTTVVHSSTVSLRKPSFPTFLHTNRTVTSPPWNETHQNYGIADGKAFSEWMQPR